MDCSRLASRTPRLNPLPPASKQDSAAAGVASHRAAAGEVPLIGEPVLRRRSWWHLRKTAFFVIDFALLWVAVQAAYRLSPRLGAGLPAFFSMENIGLPLAMAVGLQLAGVQVNQAGFRGAETLTRILIGALAGMGSFVLVHATVGYDLVGRYILGLALVQGTALVLASRWVIWRLAEIESREVFFVGRKETCRELENKMRAERLPIRLVGSVDWHGANPPPANGGRMEFSLPRPAEIVVENPDALDSSDRRILLALMSQGREVTDLGFFHEREFEAVHVDGLRESWFWGYDPAQARPVYFAFKRLIDVVVSGVGMLAFAPFGLVIAAAISFQDRGPVIYYQNRMGLHNRPFRIYKFRTMRVNAEVGGPQWAEKDDPRVTFLGKLLRRTRLDEIPQLWNIFRGEMSLIGPRPERPELCALISATVPYYPYRHIVKPGLTGWAQVNHPYGASIDDARRKLAYDLYYIKYGSLTRELHITLRTLVAIFRGAR